MIKMESSLIYYDKRDELFLVIPDQICQLLKLRPNGSVKFVIDTEHGCVFLEKGEQDGILNPI